MRALLGRRPRRRAPIAANEIVSMASIPLPVALGVVAAVVLLELLRRIAMVQRDVRRLAISEAPPP